jgi:hypothetical protein
MMTFQEFLHKKAAEQHQHERRQRRDEWIAAVGRLFDQIRAWLAEADPDHLLDVVPLEVQSIEASLGVYNIPSLKIGVGDSSVQIVPRGRDALGIVGGPGGLGIRAEGRVDITDGVRKYILYRSLQDGQERWFLLDQDFRPHPLDRARLEAALQDLLE